MSAVAVVVWRVVVGSRVVQGWRAVVGWEVVRDCAALRAVRSAAVASLWRAVEMVDQRVAAASPLSPVRLSHAKGR